MSYFAHRDLTAKYPSLAKDYDAAAVDSVWAPLACADVDAQVGQRFTVPFTPGVPLVIKNLAMDMCYWQMTYKELDQSILKDYIDERVTGILNGTIVINDPTTGTPIARASQVFLTTSGTASSFGMGRPENFHIDPEFERSYYNGWWGDCL